MLLSDMKILAVCQKCISQWQNQGVIDADIENRLLRARTPIKTDLSLPLTWTCENGHTNRMFIPAPFYELLFLRGIADAASYDYRMAVVNFYSSWECFVAFAIKILIKKVGIEFKSLSDLMRSEPQVGLYSGLYMSKTNKIPTCLSNKTRKIRNKVIHSDLIPTEEEVLALGKEVQTAIQNAKEALPVLSEDSTTFDSSRFDGNRPEGQYHTGDSIVFLRSLVNADLADEVRKVRLELSRLS